MRACWEIGDEIAATRQLAKLGLAFAHLDADRADALELAAGVVVESPKAINVIAMAQAPEAPATTPAGNSKSSMKNPGAEFHSLTSRPSMEILPSTSLKPTRSALPVAALYSATLDT